jgi:hypothetical protein
MASIVLNGDTSGSITLSPPAVAGTNTITLPAATGTVVLTGTTPTLNGITFPATQVPSADANTLDDYEEGSFTPSIDSVVAGTGRATNVYYARYTKIGNVCQFQIFCDMATVGTGGSGNAVIRGLPFTAPSSGGNAISAASVANFDSLNTTVVSVMGYVQDNSTYIMMQCVPSAAVSSQQLTFSTYIKVNSLFVIAGTYRVA